MDQKTREAILERVRADRLSCARAFEIAHDLGAAPRLVGRVATERDVHLVRCQLGLFGYENPKRIVQAAEHVSTDTEQAIQEGLVLGKLPCAVAWAISARLGIARLDVANAAEKLGVRLSDCQLGAF
jgi:hypothetical protein